MSLLVTERDGRVAALSRGQQICRLCMIVVASRYRLPVAAMSSKTDRSTRATEARHLVMYLAHTIFGLSQQVIADMLNRDRTTVSYACHQVEDRRDDAAFDDIVCYLELVLVEFKGFWEGDDEQCE